MHPDDTIVALATAPGPGVRAIVRLSGADAFRLAASLFESRPEAQLARRRFAGSVRLPEFTSLVPADMLVFPGPKSVTGQHVVELHMLSSPPLVDALVAALLRAGARAAQPGEFTLRAFLAGKLDLPRAEAVLGIIEAGDDRQLRTALSQLAGNVTRPLDGLRDDLLSLLADVEAGLDFTEEDITFVGREDLLLRLSKGLAQTTLVRKQLDERGRNEAIFRAVLVGRPNAGKSSLFNALTEGAALVSPEPGTTRDYLVRRLDLDGTAIELIDTAGQGVPRDAIDDAAQTLGRSQAAAADVKLVCVPAGEVPNADDLATLEAGGIPVATQCDRGTAPPDWLATSAVTGQGLAELRAVLLGRVRAKRESPLAPSLSRCRAHVERCIDHLRKAHGSVLFEEPAEFLALELRAALHELGEMVGAIFTDDLLDRIFSRFCIGK